MCLRKTMMILRYWFLLTAFLPVAIHASSPDIISTYAGGGPNNIPAVAANVPYPSNAAIDKQGNFYFVIASGPSGGNQVGASSMNRVYKVNTSGILTVVAGNGYPGNAGDGGPAPQAELNGPSAIAVDSSGDIYIADTQNCIVRKITASTGVINTFAGGSGCGNGGDGGPATEAALGWPTGVALDTLGNLYIADTQNDTIRKVTASTGTISTIAGTGAQGFAGDGGAATSAELYLPSSVAVDASGNIYIADRKNYRIRKVTAGTGVIHTIAGNGTNGYSGNGVAGIGAEITDVYGIGSDPNGNLFLADSDSCVVREVSAATGVITTVVGTPNQCGFAGDGALGTAAKLQAPAGVAVDSSDNMYIADTSNFRIRKAALAGNVATAAGNGSRSYAAGATALEASLSPQSATPDASGNVYIADTGNCVIRLVAAGTGDISTIAGTGPANCGYSGDGGAATSTSLNNPTKVILDSSGNIYIADQNNCAVRKVAASTGLITTVAGTPPTCGYSGNSGPATSAALSNPQGIAFDSAGDLYIADTANELVRKVSAATGVITTVAGNRGKGPGYSGDGGPATGAQLNSPEDIAVDAQGNLYIADQVNSRIRIVNSSGTINTFAGNGTVGYSGDGGPANQASLRLPASVTLDAAGDLLVGDSANHRVRWVNGQGTIYTVAGNGTFGLSGDGAIATSATLSQPQGVSADRSGNIYIADSGNSRIRQVTAIANLNSSAYSLSFAQQTVGSTSAAQPVTLTGIGELDISSIQATGDFLQTNNCPSSLASGASCVANITFKPTTTGTRTGTLVLTTNGFFDPTIIINLQGTGAGGKLTFAPAVLYLGAEVIGGTSSAQSVTFTNGSPASVNFTSATITGGSFAIASNTCTGTLAVGKTCAIGVVFKPTASGAAAATLVVSDSDSSSPQSIPLHGTGFATSISSQRLAFGTVSEGSTKTLSTTVTNKGSSSLTSISAAITGANAGDFSFTTTCGATLGPGASCSYSVTFKPTTNGAESGTLNIKDNEEPNPGFAVLLSGNG